MHPDSAFRWEDRDAMRALVSELGFGALSSRNIPGSAKRVETGPASSSPPVSTHASAVIHGGWRWRQQTFSFGR